MTFFLNICLAFLMLQASPGTQVTVPAGERLALRTSLGSVEIEAWEQDEVEVSATHSDLIQIEVKAGETVEIQEHRSPRASLEKNTYRIKLPASMAVRVWSKEGNVAIQGIKASVSVDVNHGAVAVRDVQGTILLDSSTGDLTIDRAVGDVTLDATAGSITIRGLEGTVIAETQAGPVILEDIRSSNVRVTTSKGDIFFDGVTTPGGLYDMASQSGALTVQLSKSFSARVNVGTVHGQFESAFGLGETKPAKGELFSFTVGSGEARMELVTYSGDIHLKMRTP